MKLLGTIKDILNEVANRDQIIRAIEQKQIVSIYYDSDDVGGKGYREVEPVCLGDIVKSDGTKQTYLRAWDIQGASHTDYTGEQPLPGWRLFKIDKITSWNPTGENFTSARPDYNFTGDKTMTKVIINAKFNQNV
jgi:predicted DNA-binding transcriptional regulator YafY